MGLSSAGSLPSLLHELRGRGAGDTCLIRVLDWFCLLVFVAHIGKRANECIIELGRQLVDAVARTGRAGRWQYLSKHFRQTY